MPGTLFILNDAPQAGERTRNGLRLAGALARQPGHDVRIYLMGDAAWVARRDLAEPTDQHPLAAVAGPDGMASVRACGSCLDARQIADADLAPGVQRGTLSLLATWTAEADRVLVF